MMKDIPKGWVPVSRYDDRDDKNCGGASGDYARILAAIHRDPPAIRAYRDGRCWCALEADIEELLSASGQSVRAVTPGKPAALMSSGQIESAIVALCEINNGISLMLPVLNRIAAAAESLATQPNQELSGSRRDMKDESL